MVIDASIVILENVMRLHKKGISIHNAAIEGASEMIPSIIASTLTTIAVFVPVTLCIKGLIGILFWDLSFAVIGSLLLSMLVCFTFIPVAIVYLSELKSQIPSVSHGKMGITASAGKLLRLGFAMTENVKDLFAFRLKFLLENLFYRKWVVRGVYILCFLCLILIPGRDLLPPTVMRSIVVELEHPHNLDLAYADKETKNIENVLKEDLLISKFASRIFKDKSFVYIDLKEGMSRKKEAERYFRELRNKLETTTTSEVYVYNEPKLDTTEGAGWPIEIQVYQDKKSGEQDGLSLFKDSIKSEKDLVYTHLSSKRQPSQIHVIPEKRELHELGLTSEDISKILQAHLYGKKIKGVHEDVLVKGELDKQGLENLPLYVTPQTKPGTVRSLASLAHLSTLEQEKIYERAQKKPVMKVLAHLTWDKSSLGKILGRIRKELSAIGLDSFISSSLHLMETVFNDLYVALLVAIILIFIIMAALFESLLHSFVMLLSIPLASIGVWIGLFLSGHELNVSVMLGAIILVGTVVNNAIILIDTINTKRRAGEDRNQAIIESVRQRTRPILMTMLTTVLAMFPLVYAKGAASEMYNGLAVVVLSGLFTSTFLTLILIPLVYVSFEDFLDGIFRYFLNWKTGAHHESNSHYL
ncbi:MAG TPA: efflux RND transporter permease subunit, partial [Bdellovibrionota bacterium]|nr:efflux RND transporter permease subunit [Bdellovibrionota bacterium]